MGLHITIAWMHISILIVLLTFPLQLQFYFYGNPTWMHFSLETFNVSKVFTWPIQQSIKMQLFQEQVAKVFIPDLLFYYSLL